jgi:23S rRNA pseudouridine2605 synthase
MKDGTRLNKYLASCAVGSRRACDELIQAGRVEVNGSTCTKLATQIQPGDHVRVDGRRVAPRDLTIVAFHKPRGYVCTRGDELGRETIYDLLPASLQALHHVGRLDRDSEGLLILTNDGDLSQRLMHPSKSVEKEYLVTANQAFENVHLDQFLEGVYTEGGKLRALSIERLSARRIKVVLDHGAKRQIRVMLEAMGYSVTKLLRVRIGQLWLGDLEPGQWAILTEPEVAMLLGATTPTKKRSTPAAAAKSRPTPAAEAPMPARRPGPAKPRSAGFSKSGSAPKARSSGQPGVLPTSSKSRSPRKPKSFAVPAATSQAKPAKAGFAKRGGSQGARATGRPPRKNRP